MKRTKATKDGRKLLMQMLAEPPSATFNYISVDNRRDNNEAPDCCIEIEDARYRTGGYLLCRVPIGDDDSHTAMLDITSKVSKQWDFAHGYAGYTRACNGHGPKAILAERMYYGIGMRHPGIDLPSAPNTSFVITAGIKRVNWLTLLGSEMSQQAGSLNGLTNSSGIIVHRTGPGLIDMSFWRVFFQMSVQCHHHLAGIRRISVTEETPHGMSASVWQLLSAPYQAVPRPLPFTLVRSDEIVRDVIAVRATTAVPTDDEAFSMMKKTFEDWGSLVYVGGFASADAPIEEFQLDVSKWAVCATRSSSVPPSAGMRRGKPSTV